MSEAKKVSYWFKLDVSYFEITASIPWIKEVRFERGKSFSRQGFTFIVDGHGLDGVTFQLTKGNKLGIFMPKGMDLESVIDGIQSILEEAAGRRVRLTPLFTKQEPSTQVPTTSQMEAAIAGEIKKTSDSVGKAPARVRLTESMEEGISRNIISSVFGVYHWLLGATDDVNQWCKWPAEVNELIEQAKQIAQRMWRYVMPALNKLPPHEKEGILQSVVTVPKKHEDEFRRSSAFSPISLAASRSLATTKIKIAEMYLEELKAPLNTLVLSSHGEDGSVYKVLLYEAEKVSDFIKRILDSISEG